MTKLIVDPATRDRLAAATDVLEICDEEGRTIGFFHRLGTAVGGGKGPRSPYSDEEIQELRKQRTGKPLSEILKGLGAS